LSEPSNRLAVLRSRLAARTDHEGKAMPGFAENVAAIRAEIARREGKAQ
jgi:hypothetical protein